MIGIPIFQLVSNPLESYINGTDIVNAKSDVVSMRRRFNAPIGYSPRKVTVNWIPTLWINKKTVFFECIQNDLHEKKLPEMPALGQPPKEKQLWREIADQSRSNNRSTNWTWKHHGRSPKSPCALFISGAVSHIDVRYKSPYPKESCSRPSTALLSAIIGPKRDIEAQLLSFCRRHLQWRFSKRAGGSQRISSVGFRCMSATKSSMRTRYFLWSEKILLFDRAWRKENAAIHLWLIVLHHEEGILSRPSSWSIIHRLLFLEAHRSQINIKTHKSSIPFFTSESINLAFTKRLPSLSGRPMPNPLHACLWQENYKYIINSAHLTDDSKAQSFYHLDRRW